MVDESSPATSSGAWTMTQERFAQFVGMSKDIEGLKKDLERMDRDLKDFKQSVSSDMKDIKGTLGKIEKSMAADHGAASTWPSAGRLLIGALMVIGTLGGWGLAIWHFARTWGQ